MSRSLDAATVSSFGEKYVEFCHLFFFDFSTPQYLTDHHHDITWGGNTYESTGRVLSLGSIKETGGISNPTLAVTLSGANPVEIALPFTEDYNNKRVVIRKVLFDNSGETTSANISGNPYIIWDGPIDSWSITDDPQGGSSTVTWKIASHWADWEKVRGRKCNNQSSQRYYPTEEGFTHVYDQIGDVLWGRVNLTGG